MPLRIDLGPHEKIFLNGAVVTNGATRASLTLLNDAAILREKDILTEETANTPCKRIYLAIQLMYMDGNNFPRYYEAYRSLATGWMQIAPDTAQRFKQIDEDLSCGRLYQALKLARGLIKYEKELSTHGHQSP